MVVRHAQPEDAATLSAFGRRVFHDTFAPLNNPADLAAYLDSAYTEQRQLAEILDPAVVTLMLELEGTLVAFAQLRSAATGDGVPGQRPVELWRFYVDPAWHGKGVATTFMDAVEEAARARGADTLWLGVWEKNIRAQAFYRKCGFTAVGSHIFVVGTDPQRDLVMSKALTYATEVPDKV
jgi:GNAT superfamily N-acetyltransferase